MRAPNTRRPCDRCGDPEPIPLGHYCWDEKRARAAVLRAIHYFTSSPDRCDMEGSEDDVADEVLSRLRGDDLIPGRFTESRDCPSDRDS